VKLACGLLCSGIPIGCTHDPDLTTAYLQLLLTSSLNPERFLESCPLAEKYNTDNPHMHTSPQNKFLSLFHALACHTHSYIACWQSSISAINEVVNKNKSGDDAGGSSSILHCPLPMWRNIDQGRPVRDLSNVCHAVKLAHLCIIRSRFLTLKKSQIGDLSTNLVTAIISP
jgi:hypothetical protein